MPPPKDPLKRIEWINERKERMKNRIITEEIRQNMRIAARKRILDPKWQHNHRVACEKVYKDPEYRKRLSEVHTGLPSPKKGRPISLEQRQKIAKTLTGKYRGINCPTCDKEYFLKHGHLKSSEPYCDKFNKKRKYSTRSFFNFMCICSGELERDLPRSLNVHHVDHDKEQGCNGKPFNLVPMNDTHHAKERFKELEYKNYINKTLQEGFKWGIWNEKEYIENVMYDE